MQFGLLSCQPVSVSDVIGNHQVDSQLLAVHGVVYYGEHSAHREVLILPHPGPFDGYVPPVPPSIDRQACLLIEHDYDELYQKFGTFAQCGGSLWNFDAILVGQVRFCPETANPARLSHLQIVVAQSRSDIGHGRYSHLVAVATFRQACLPAPSTNDRVTELVEFYPD